MGHVGDRAYSQKVNEALDEGAEALRGVFCEAGTNATWQSIVLKDRNGCAMDEACRKTEGLPELQLFSQDKLVTDPNETGDRLEWKNKNGEPQSYTVKDCAPTS